MARAGAGFAQRSGQPGARRTAARRAGGHDAPRPKLARIAGAHTLAPKARPPGRSTARLRLLDEARPGVGGGVRSQRAGRGPAKLGRGTRHRSAFGSLPGHRPARAGRGSETSERPAGSRLRVRGARYRLALGVPLWWPDRKVSTGYYAGFRFRCSRREKTARDAAFRIFGFCGVRTPRTP